MNKKIILITSIITIGVMAIVSCTKTAMHKELTYDDVKDQIAVLEKNIGKKKRQTFPSSGILTSIANPAPVITEFKYCGSINSPLGSNYTRFKYRIDVSQATKNYFAIMQQPQSVFDRNGRHIEIRIGYGGLFNPNYVSGLKKNIPYTSTTFPMCYFVDVNNNGLAIPDKLTMSVENGVYQANNTINSNYWVDYGTYNGFMGSFNGTPSSVSISKLFVLDGLGSQPNPCP